MYILSAAFVFTICASWQSWLRFGAAGDELFTNQSTAEFQPLPANIEVEQLIQMDRSSSILCNCQFPFRNRWMICSSIWISCGFRNLILWATTFKSQTVRRAFQVGKWIPQANRNPLKVLALDSWFELLFTLGNGLGRLCYLEFQWISMTCFELRRFHDQVLAVSKNCLRNAQNGRIFSKSHVILRF